MGGVELKISDGLPAQPEMVQQSMRRLPSHLTGPLLGLGYIITLPIAGIIGALLLVGYCVKQRLLALGRWAVQTTSRS